MFFFNLGVLHFWPSLFIALLFHNWLFPHPNPTMNFSIILHNIQPQAFSNNWKWEDNGHWQSNLDRWTLTMGALVSSIFMASAIQTVQLELKIEPSWLFTGLSKPMMPLLLWILTNDEVVLKSAFSLTYMQQENLSLLLLLSKAHMDMSRNRYPGHLPPKKYKVKKNCIAVFTSNTINLGYFLASKSMYQCR